MMFNTHGSIVFRTHLDFHSFELFFFSFKEQKNRGWEVGSVSTLFVSQA